MSERRSFLILHGIDISQASAKTERIDLDRPIPDVVTGGADYLFVTAFAAGRPLGSVFVPSPTDPCPAEVLSEALGRFALPMHREILLAAHESADDPRRPLATIVIATCDRPKHLARCLASVARLSYEPLEVVVVDNGVRRAETEALAREAGAEYVIEAIPGHARARNRGLSIARGEIVLYTDDDVELDPEWAGRLVACFDDSLVMEAGGLVLTAHLNKPAHWLAETTAKHGRGAERRTLDGAMVSPTRAAAGAVGASMAFRTSFLRSLGGFPEELGLGTPSMSGEDTWAAHRVLRAGYRVVYEPAAVSYHDPVDDIVDLRKKVRGYGIGTGTYLLHTAWADRDPSAIRGLVLWARYIAGKTVGAALRRPGAPTLALASAELMGIFRVPLAYSSARRRVRRLGRVLPRPAPPVDAPWLDGLDEPGPSEEAKGLPGISIVIPTRGRRDRIVELVRALDVQEYPDDLVEIVVSVDGDVDGTARALEEVDVRRRPRVVIGEHGGAAAARNRGAAVASKEILVFLDDDVLPIHKSFLHAHGRAHLRGRSAVVGPCLPDFRDSRDFLAQHIRNWWVVHAGRLFRTSALDFADLSTGNFSLPRDVFVELNGFLEMRAREDWEFGYRLLAAMVPLRPAPDAVVVQELDVGLVDLLGHQRDAGASDFVFAQRHPAALFRLQLGEWRDEGPEPPHLTRSRLSRRIGEVQLLTSRLVLGLLELVGARTRFAVLLDKMERASYWTGVAEASGGDGAWFELARIAEASVRDAVTFDLEDDDWTPPGVNGPPDAAIIYKGVALGRVPLRCGGIPWDARHFAAEAIRRVAIRAASVDADT